MEIYDIEYYEYDCGDPCTVDGCPGHVTDVPIGFTFNGIQFYVAGAEGGDFPGSNKEEIKEVQEAFKLLMKMKMVE